MKAAFLSRYRRKLTIPLLCWIAAALLTTVATVRPLRAQQTAASLQPVAAMKGTTSSVTGLTVTVADENGVAVPAAHIVLTGRAGRTYSAETDHSGKCVFSNVNPGNYVVRIEKPGFYRLSLSNVQIGVTGAVDATLLHEQEVHESIEVTESPTVIDPTQTADVHSLTGREILNVPYPTSRDIRHALPLIPTVVRDQNGNIHVGGASVTQTLNILDGFNVGVPTTSFEDIHVNVDAIRSIQAESSRYSAEYGKGTSVLGFGTGIGDDKFRFSATNFLPSFQTRKGLTFNQWVPRAVVSGPIVKGRAWFYDAPDAEYNLDVFKELPDGADRASSWRLSNLSKVQVNITPSNILMTEFLINGYHAPNAGLSPFNPLETTVDQHARSWVAAVRDQHYFQSGVLLETGVAIDRFTNTSVSLGSQPYIIVPGKVSGSFFESTTGMAHRIQGIVNLYLAPVQWHGRHDLRIGMDLDRVSYQRDFGRGPIFMQSTNGATVRTSTFTGTPRVDVNNFEASGYFQDRWSVTDRLLIEAGLRTDWDRIIRRALLSPRFAATYGFGDKGQTKLSAGVGVFYQATNLDLIGRPEAGVRVDRFFAPVDGLPVDQPVQSEFFVNRNSLKEPRFVTTSFGLEHKLPHDVYTRLDFVRKSGADGFVFLNRNPNQIAGTYDLTNARRDRYNAVTVSVQHTFRDTYPSMFSYTRSSTRSNAVYDFSQSTPVIGPQQGGPLPWDTPNRIVSWGWAPFFKKTILGYALEWRDGYPFTAVNVAQRIVGTPSSYRFPRYFTLDVSLEKRFHLMGYYLALRGTVEDITGRNNANFVENNVDAPNFGSFGGTSHRAFTARIRFLGRSGPKNSSQTSQPKKP